MLRRFMKSNSKATNRDNARVSKSLDTYHSSSLRHYCGRLVENENYCNPCGLCDGRCGPDNGCQCKACDELDKEIERRGDILGSRNFVNEAARPVHVSFSIDSHDPIGHYRFYCGANVGRNNYPVPCDECDGRCGPDNGCQCVACNELEAILESVELSRGLNSVQIEVPSIDQNIISSSDGIGSKSIDNFDTEISPQYYLEKKIQNLTSLADCENMSQILNSLQNKLSAKKDEIILKTKSTSDDANTCIICFSDPKCVLLLPCKHLCLCENCSRDIKKLRGCPLCSAQIESHMKIYT